MLKMAILGFLRDFPLHGYDLKNRVASLAGHVRPVADGTLYPTIKKLEDAQCLTRRTAPGSVAAPRHMLEITQIGTDQLRRWLRDPEPGFITDDNKWYVLLAFLHHLENPREQALVLARRREFLDQPAQLFFDADGTPVPPERLDSPFRKGLMQIHRSTNLTEIDWLDRQIGDLNQRAGYAVRQRDGD
ncbi:PadR family transcriptional regulator [Glycomyces sp. NPDC047010]|uniref:PadR family transcriptional regulator n=1 Tax=Glycomyces mayteni TaxID=543887 RepID=A0ABW2DEQ5_9ACTN|nr:PadR family transcriptional regulator [Glycomyces mayteni]